MKKYKCPCCECLTLNSPPPGDFEICPVCYWEDDNVQYADPFFEGGANEPSLDQARNNFQKFGASSKDFIDVVRSPLPEEQAFSDA